MNIIEAVKLFRNGKKVHRKSVREVTEIYGSSGNINGNWMIYTTKGRYELVFLEDDILADDWEVVE